MFVVTEESLLERHPVKILGGVGGEDARQKRGECTSTYRVVF